MRLTIHGAAETVTGSRFLLESGASTVLVDCGLFQGVKRLRKQNWDGFPVDPASIDAVVVTHAHIDHSGYLPALVRDGFGGPIWCTPATAALLRIMLLDSAHLQQEEARFVNKHRTSKHHPALPLYTTADAEAALNLLHTTPYEAPFNPARGFTAAMHNAGHILGSSTVRIADATTSVVFTGDVGRPVDPVLHPPAPLPTADFVVTESTYGNRHHVATDPKARLAEIVRDAAASGGTVLIPSFAVGRAQSILHYLAELQHAGEIPQIPMFLNSPMSIEATELLTRFPNEHRLLPEQCERINNAVTFVRTAEESKALTERSGPLVVVSASGMATGGRVLHHLRSLAPHHKNTIVFTGFQAAGTRGEALINGARRVKIFGSYVPVRADVVQLDGLSAHADQGELLAWLGAAPAPRCAFVVHGELSAADAFRRELHDELGWRAIVPVAGEQFDLSLNDPAWRNHQSANDLPLAAATQHTT